MGGVYLPSEIKRRWCALFEATARPWFGVKHGKRRYYISLNDLGWMDHGGYGCYGFFGMNMFSGRFGGPCCKSPCIIQSDCSSALKECLRDGFLGPQY